MKNFYEIGHSQDSVMEKYRFTQPTTANHLPKKILEPLLQRRQRAIHPHVIHIHIFKNNLCTLHMRLLYSTILHIHP